MHRILIGLTLSLCLALPARAQDPQNIGSWAKVMYLGGAVGVTGKSMTWDGTITVSPKSIRLTRQFIDTPTFDIDTSSVTELVSADQRHVNDGAAAALGLLGGALIKSTDRYVTIFFAMPDGTKSAVLLRLDKGNAQAIMDALHAVTKK